MSPTSMRKVRRCWLVCGGRGGTAGVRLFNQMCHRRDQKKRAGRTFGKNRDELIEELMKADVGDSSLP